MTSPPPRVPSAHQTGWLTESLMNLTEPSPARTLTPPGWKLSRLAKTERLPEPVLEQWVHWSCREFGVTTVLNIEETIPPCIQSRPRWTSVLAEVEFQAA